MWSALFSFTNGLAFLCWALLLLAPRRPLPLAFILYGGVALLCASYTVGMAAMLLGVDPGGVAGGDVGFSSIGGVRAFFATDAGVAIGWTHYLALDLFVGLWIAKDADAKGFPRLVQTPFLLLTFLAGPVGLLVWLTVREKRARAHGRPQ